MVINTHLRSMKRVKQRITADLHDILTFPATADGISADLHGPFRENVRALLDRHARASPADGFAAGNLPGVRTWRVAFKAGEAVEYGDSPATVELVIVEEDVARSNSIYCDQCRVVGWSGHPVCKERYHFIIENKDDHVPSSYVCTRCKNTSPSCNLRCNVCGHEMSVDDVENFSCSKLLDNPSHLLHGMVHTNGYGHLLRVNGREGGSKLLAGYHIMSFWDRLCKLLQVRKITVMDVSKKFGLEYRLLHTVATGYPWYAKWGYEFHVGSFALTAAAYQKAIDTLSSTPLSLFLSDHRQPRSQLQNTILFYHTLSGHKLETVRDLLEEISKVDVAQVETTLIKILNAVSRSRWVTAHALRGAACRRAKSPEVIDHCLQSIEGKILNDGSIITTRYNADARTIEYSLEAAHSRPFLDESSKQTAEHILHDLQFLYDSLLNPSIMEAYKPKTRRDSALSAAATLLDCKQLIKHYDEASHWMLSHPSAFTVWCHIKPNGKIAPPQEPVLLPLSATVADLKREATKALQETYLIFRHFQAEQLLDFRCMDDKSHVKNLIGSNGTARIEGKCFNEQKLDEFNTERGTENWVVDCACGAKDDDGERMLACDACAEWQHTRCVGIHDFEEVPAQFLCVKCIHNQSRSGRPRKRPRASLPAVFRWKQAQLIACERSPSYPLAFQSP